MTSFLYTQTPRLLVRRIFALSGLLLCLSMATSNLVGAFAVDTQTQTTVMVAADLEKALGSEKKTVVVSVTSIDEKSQVINEINSKLDVVVHNDLDELPIFSVDNIGIKDIDTLVSIVGISGIEPVREFTSTTVDYLEAIHAEGIADPTDPTKDLDGSGTTIGIIDSGLNVNHLQFKNATGNRIVSQGCINQADIEIAPCSTDPNQSAQIDCVSRVGSCWHGQAVAGFAAGNPIKLELNDGSGQVNIQGVAPKADISYFRIASSEDNGPTNISILAAFNKFLGDKRNHPTVAPDVINLSIGWEYEDIPSCGYFTSLKTTIDTVVNSGITVVAAAGNNSNKSHIASPACFESVISVGATEFEKNENGQIIGEHVARYSNTSSELDLVAPGTKLYGSTPSEDYYPATGTSFASPLVAGSVALLKQAKSSLTPLQIKNLLTSNADLVKDPTNGKSYPRINVAKAVTAINSTPPTTTTHTTGAPSSTTSPSTTQPTTTTTFVPATTRPAPEDNQGVQTTITVSSDRILTGESVLVTVGLANNGTQDISEITTQLKVRDHVFKTVKTPILENDSSNANILEMELTAVDLAFAGKDPNGDVDPIFSNDIVAISCWKNNICVEANQNVKILEGYVDYLREMHSDGTTQIYEDTITNIGTETITNFEVTDTDLGVLKFNKSTLAPGESATTGQMDVGADYAPGFWEISVVGTVLGRTGLIGASRLGEHDFDTFDPQVTTTTTTVATTAVPETPVSVAGQTITRGPSDASSLPFTGSSTSQLFFAAIWILLAGVMLLCFKHGFTQRALVKVSIHK